MCIRATFRTRIRTRRKSKWAVISSSFAANRCAANSATALRKPEPFTPGETTAVNWTMPDVFHTFRRGHRIMIQVQSSWFPLVDRNPQKFCDINTATADDFQKATERVYHSPQAPSQLRVEVLASAAAAGESQP